MKHHALITICLLAAVCLLLAGCGPAGMDENAAATQAAATSYAGQTVQAQAVTPTPLPDTSTPPPAASAQPPLGTPTSVEPTPAPTFTPAPPTATPTRRATPTRAPTRTPTPIPEPVAVSELGEGLTCAQVFREDFTRPSGDWPSGSNREGRWGPTEGEYQILVEEADYFFSWTNGLRAADFVLEMDAYYASDNPGAYGLIFGLNSLDNGQDFYVFFVDATGYFALFSHTDDSWTTLRDWTYSPALATGPQTNRLRVERRGDAISLSANGQFLATARDDTYTGPRYISLAAESFEVGGVDVRFDNIVACQSPTWPVASATPALCPNGSPTNTWTLTVINPSGQEQSFSVDGKGYTVPAGGTTHVYLSLNVAHPVTADGNSINYSNDQPCGENTLTLSAPAPQAEPTPVPPPAVSGKGTLIMLNCLGDVVTVDVVPAGIFQELAPKTGPDCQPGQPILLDPGEYTLKASIAGVPSQGEAKITVLPGATLTFTWY